MFTYTQLSTPVSETDARAMLIQRLSDLGFSATSWQSGSVQLTILMLVSWLYAQLTSYVAALVQLCFNDTSTGDGLTKFSLSNYDNTRIAATYAQHRCTLTLAPGQGPYTINASDLVGTNGVATFRNITGGTLNSTTSPLSLTFQAETAGTGTGNSNNAAQNTITVLQTPLAGVTITNPDATQIQYGQDAESDAALRLRNSTKWATLAIDMPTDGYKNVALTAGAGRARVDDTNPRGPGTVDVYVAATNGTASAGTVTAVQTALNARRAITADVLAIASTATTIVIAGTVYATTQITDTVTQTAVKNAISGYINTLAIGGAPLTASTNGVPLAAIEGAVLALNGTTNLASGVTIRNIVLTSPTGDTTLPTFGIALADAMAGLSFVQVS